MKRDTIQLFIATCIVVTLLILDAKYVHTFDQGTLGLIWFTAANGTLAFFLIHLVAWTIQDLKGRPR
jgi:hypothetical protein